MRSSFLETPLASLSTIQRLAIGSALATIGGALIVLSLMLGWSELPRPWAFVLGFTGGLTGGAGAALALCGLVSLARRRD